MKKTILLCLFAVSVITAKAQYTLNIAIPKPIPEFNGTYEDFAQNHFFYPNGGEIRFADEFLSDAIEDVAFYTKFAYPQKYIRRNNNISFVFHKPDTIAGGLDSLHRFDLEMDRGNMAAFPARVDTQSNCILNYFTQRFGSNGRVDVRGSAGIVVQNIYPNIDMVYTSNISGLKIYYIVYPGGDPNQIVLHFKGSKSNAISGSDLLVDANWDGIKFEKPQMYQYTLISNVVTPVTVCNASWQNVGSDRYKINNTDPYNTSLPLIIEVKQGPGNPPPSILNGIKWSTYFGNDFWDYVHKTHNDANNNLYVGGETSSSTFPGTTGPIAVIQSSVNSSDGFISKFNASGQLKWSTYIGGSGPEDIVDFDFNGNDIYCVGSTFSNDLPFKMKSGAFNDTIFAGAAYDGFVFQIGFLSNGNLQNKWTAYFGGNDVDRFSACKFDNNGNLFVVGYSASTNLSPVGSAGMYQQTFNTAQTSQAFTPVPDAIIMRFDAGTSAQSWFTFYGTSVLGTNAANVSNDYFFGVDILGSNVYACGKSGGTDLPNTINGKFLAGSYDGMLANFNTGGILFNSKFTSGSLVNYAVKANGSYVYVTGMANSSMTPINSGNYYYDGTCATGDNDAFFGVYSLNLGSSIHNTFLGGSKFESAYDIQFAANNVFYIAGGTLSNNFPTTNLGVMYNAAAAGGLDNFVAAFIYGSSNMLWGTYLGSPGHETLYQPNGGVYIAADTQGFLHLGGCTASSNTFPLDNGGGIPYYQTQNNATSTTGTVTRFNLTALNTFVGIEDFKNTAFSFGIYPNPASAYLTIDNTELANQQLKYAVYDLTGKKLAEGKLEGEQKRIDVSFLQQGVYIVNVSNGTRTFSNRFIKSGN